MTHIDTSREAVANLMRSAREAGYMTVRGTLQEMSAALAALLDRAEKAEAELDALPCSLSALRWAIILPSARIYVTCIPCSPLSPTSVTPSSALLTCQSAQDRGGL
jgi:hypothetical protein